VKENIMRIRGLLQVALLALGLALHGAALVFRGCGVDGSADATIQQHGAGVCCARCQPAARAARDVDLLDELSCKIDPCMAAGGNCLAPSRCSDSVAVGEPDDGLNPFFPAGPRLKDTAEKGRVAAMVDQALNDQARLLKLRQAQLRRWDSRARAHFAVWFGTTDERAREMIFERAERLLKINDAYAVRNFHRAVPSRPGIFAFVHPTDPTKVFLDRQFVLAPALGTNSRAGTITHEMSHFTIAGGTKDHAYGTDKCRALAKTNPALALTNADNFEYYVEGVR
jgi:hypothetical protein